MESFTEAATTDSPPCTFSQVVFISIPHSYPLSTPITCKYTLTSAFQPNPRDWVGIFKVGWSTIKDYHTFVWVEPYLDVVGQQSVTRQAVFKDYYLPKDEIDFYQFCYIDKCGQVRGASTPFCFRHPVEQSLSNLDEDLLVITTEEQLKQSICEKAELQKDLSQITEENETLKRALEKEQQEVASLKGQNEQKEKEKTELVKELDQMKEQNEILKQKLKETDHLKEMTHQIETQEYKAAEQNKMSPSLTSDGASKQNETQEKYDQAVMEILQLKEEREELRGRVDALSEKTSTLNSKIREEDREVLKMKDNIQLLQFDLQSSEKEKERLLANLQRLQSLVQNMDDMERENQESQQETLQDSADEDLRIKLREAHEEIADKGRIIKEMERMTILVSQEKEELARENQNLTSDVEELHSVIAQLHGAPPADSPHMKPDTTSPAGTTPPTQWQEPKTPEQAENLYENMENFADQGEEPLVCHHCQEHFPLLTQQELVEHELSHRICPFCTMICDNMEQSVFEDHVYGHEL